MPSLDVSEIEMSEYMAALISLIKDLSNQVVRAQSIDPEGKETKVKVGDWVRVQVHKRMWTEPRWTGPYEVKEVTSHSVQVRGKAGAKWHHLTHCAPAPSPLRILNEVRTDLEKCQEQTESSDNVPEKPELG